MTQSSRSSHNNVGAFDRIADVLFRSGYRLLAWEKTSVSVYANVRRLGLRSQPRSKATLPARSATALVTWPDVGVSARWRRSRPLRC